MEQTADSTRSYTEAEDQAGRQDTMGYYIDEIIRRLAERPFDSAPQLFQFATRGGACLSQGDVLRLFGGRVIFRQTRRRMNAIRRAVLNDTMDTFPVDLRTWAGGGWPDMDPPFRDHRSYWNPHLDSPSLWRYEEPGLEEEI